MAGKKTAAKKPAEKAPAKKPAEKAPAKKPAEKAPAKKPAAKETRAATDGGKEVIVGRLTDWPLGARLVKLMGLPDAIADIGCFQVLGQHGKAVSAKVFEVPETISPGLAPFEARIHAALSVCSEHRASSITVNSAFHANLSPEELAAHLRNDYLIRTPAEALEARRLTPQQSLRKIEKALEKAAIGRPRKYVLEYLEGGPLRESLLGIDAFALSYVFPASPETYNEVDSRLFHLWARTTLDSFGPPMPQPGSAELGFDRFGAHRKELVAAGLSDDAAMTYLLRRKALEHARWWPSTGVWVWEQLEGESTEALERTLASSNVEPRMIDLAVVELLTSVLWLPEGALKAGALAAVLKACDRPELVPDGSLTELRKDKDFAPLLAPVKRSAPPPAPPTGRGAALVRQAQKLIPG